MSKRTRYFLVGSVAFLIVGLSIGVVAYYNGGLKALVAQSGPAELQYVPKDATVVAFANVHDIMNSNFRQRMKELEAGKGERGQQEFRDETGIDIEKDVDSVMAFATGGDPSRTGGVVMATGRFDQARISDLVRQKGGAVETVGGRTLMTFTPPGHPDSGGALAFLRPDQVAIGSAASVRALLDGSATSGGDVTKNDNMMRLIGQVSSGNAWVVGRFDALSSHAHLPPQVASRIPPISWFSAWGDIDGGIKGELSVEATNQESAENLVKVVEGLKGLAALQAQNANVPSQLQQLLNSFGIRQDGQRLTLTFSVPSSVLDGLVQMGRKPGDGPGK